MEQDIYITLRYYFSIGTAGLTAIIYRLKDLGTFSVDTQRPLPYTFLRQRRVSIKGLSGTQAPGSLIRHEKTLNQKINQT